jgi:hypothetical protein
MISVNRALRSDRLIRATTGLSALEFKPLLASFYRELQKERRIRYERYFERGVRERKPGGGRIGSLRTPTEKLFFILFYYKCYPTFDVLGLLFDLDRSNACRNVQKLTLIAENVLEKKMVLPERKISTVEELLELYLTLRTYLSTALSDRSRGLKTARSRRQTILARRRRTLARTYSSPIRTGGLGI